MDDPYDDLPLFRPQTSERRVFSVGELTLQIKDTLENEFESVWVAGELVDVTHPRSGHVYLTLKDEQAQIRGVIWRLTAGRLKFRPEDGQQVICRGQLNVYPPRGTYQLVIQWIEPRGEGAAQLALRQLQQRLAREGLFDPARKKSLPRFPRRVAFVTSPTGAAIRDFLEVARRRWGGVDVLVVPARVQGDGAAAEIVRGIRVVNRLSPAPDVLVVGRGGGSAEDLGCFNEEAVVRAICESRVPVVSAVGHEIDVTLADLAADVRALTPSEAAERVIPAREEWLDRLKRVRQRMDGSLRVRLERARLRLDGLARRRPFRRPHDRLHDLARGLDELSARATRALANRASRARDRLAALAGKLDSLSPLQVLARGYSLTQREPDGALVTEASQVRPGDRIRTRLQHGELISQIIAPQ